MKPRFFATPEKFRAWLVKNHARASELLAETRDSRLEKLIAACAAGKRL